MSAADTLIARQRVRQVDRATVSPARGKADEVIDAIAKTVAELTMDGFIRKQVIEQLMRQIMDYDAEFRHEEATSAVGSSAKH